MPRLSTASSETDMSEFTKESPNLSPADLIRGGRYNWKGQPERLIYIGRDRSGTGKWHQFAKVEEPARVCCEILDTDLRMIEKTPDDASTPDPSHAFDSTGAMAAAWLGAEGAGAAVDRVFGKKAEKAATPLRTALDLTLTAEESAYLWDTMGEDRNDLSPIRLLVGDGPGGYGLYVASAEYQEEGVMFVCGIRNKDALETAAKGHAADPSGDPAKMFDAMAAAIRAGDDYHATLRRFGLAELSDPKVPPLSNREMEHEEAGYAADAGRLRALLADFGPLWSTCYRQLGTTSDGLTRQEDRIRALIDAYMKDRSL